MCHELICIAVLVSSVLIAAERYGRDAAGEVHERAGQVEVARAVQDVEHVVEQVERVARVGSAAGADLQAEHAVGLVDVVDERVRGEDHDLRR